MRFSSSIIPPYLKRSKTMEEFIPWLYLRGISSGDFNEALGSLLGQGASGLSASTVVNLKRCWEEEYRDWNKRDLKGKEYVYIWADGIYPRIRLDNSESQCFLVIMGATSEGKKEHQHHLLGGVYYTGEQPAKKKQSSGQIHHLGSRATTA